MLKPPEAIEPGVRDLGGAELQPLELCQAFKVFQPDVP